MLSTLGSPAIPIGWLTESIETYAPRLFDFMPNTQAFNNTGQPAMTVPLSWSKSGLPIGVQFVGRHGEVDEAELGGPAGALGRQVGAGPGSAQAGRAQRKAWRTG